MRFSGGCHCGKVRFEVDIETLEALDCNCSICVKKGFLHAIVERDRFKLTAGTDEMSSYRFGSRLARHMFCRNCGIHAFYIPRSHPNGVDVNVRCLDGDIAAFKVTPFDGKNWEENVESIR